MITLRSVFAVLALLLCLPGRAQTPVNEAGFVTIGGIQQWLTIKGDDSANPVILFLHGGPANPLSPYADAIYGAWQKDYTLVQWDQRGGGMTYGANPAPQDSRLTVAQMSDDGIAVTNYLLHHLGKRKLILMGSSWGSILGVHMIKARPQLFYAYIGTAQVVDYRTSQRASYHDVLALASAAGDHDTVERLNALGTPPWTNPRSFGVLRRAVRKYEALSTEPAPDNWWKRAPLYATPKALLDFDEGEDYSFLQFVGQHGDGMFSRVDLAALGPTFHVPFLMVQGAQDLLTRPAIGRSYFDSIVAPHKTYVLVPRAGHDPNPAMLAAQYRLLREQVQPLLADPAQ